MNIKLIPHTSLGCIGIAKEVVKSIVDNYISIPYDNASKLQLYADIQSVMGIIWRGAPFKIVPEYSSMNIKFNFSILFDENDPLEFTFDYDFTDGINDDVDFQ